MSIGSRCFTLEALQAQYDAGVHASIGERLKTERAPLSGAIRD
jgi:hypothetical protein